ncbi:MAG TPA: HlyD family efflux transporter periplasmic adaptor subunit [Thermoanaerobaculia bacterium]|nr:HlyD family efflux transporter periplasmic adaptor subunit [Thermoanaerobaculia bacterium]
MRSHVSWPGLPRTALARSAFTRSAFTRSALARSALTRAALACAALAGAAAASLAGCRGPAPAAGSPGPTAGFAAPVAAGTGTPTPEAAALAVRRGDLAPRLLLSGELRAARALAVVVPATPSFEVQIRWLAEDGSRVAAGEPVVEFDNTSLLAKLEEQRLAADTAAADLARIQAQARADQADKEFAVEQARSDLVKARIAAAVLPELLPGREYQDRQLKRQQADTALGKAIEDLAAQRAKAASDVGVQRIVLDQARREVAVATAAIRDLTLRAQRDSLVVVGEHLIEGRKLQAGDNVWAGMTVATLPETSSMLVDAALSDVDDGRVAPGMPATCVLDAYPESRYRGRVVEVAGVARESRRTALLRSIAVSIALDPVAPAEAARLRPGMSARVEIAGAPVRDALLVPRAALELGQSGAPPRVRLAGGGAAPVRLGPCDAFWCVAASGVQEGEALRALAPRGVS